MDKRELSYLSLPLNVQQEGNVNFLLDASFSSLPLYFALKQKHDYYLANKDIFIADVKSHVEAFAKDFDLIIYPESRFPFVKEIVGDLPAIELRKRNKAEIIDAVVMNAKWCKQEYMSAKAQWQEMGETFTINKIKSNKRHLYVPHLFQAVNVPSDSKILLLDDFVMSGNTIKAMAAAINTTQHETFGVFYQAQ